MEIKVNENAIAIQDLLGIEKKRVQQMAIQNLPLYLEYMKELVKDPEDGIHAENKLFIEIIRNCKTREEELLMSFHFVGLIKELINVFKQEMTENLLYAIR